MLAAGVAVLSMCACTEANEFTPSTNNSTKKITEIKVASNASALGTRTEFDTSDNNFGVVTWEKGVDELYFFKDGQNSKYQIFTCGDDDNSGKDSNYDWNYFSAKGEGLDVDGDYYAYYFPNYSTVTTSGTTINYKNNLITQKSVDCSTFYIDNTITEDGGMLKDFMHNYDLLASTACSNGSFDYVHVTDPMGDIYMDHPFALVTVDLLCREVKGGSKDGMGNFKSYEGLPSYYQAELQGLYDVDSKSQCENLLANSYTIGSDGKLTFVYNPYVDGAVPKIVSIYDTEKYYYLINGYGTTYNKSLFPESQDYREKLSFYFLVHQNENSEKTINKLKIFIDTEADYDEGHKNSDDKSIEIFLDENKTFNFEPGKCYGFVLYVDYGYGYGDNTADEDYSANSHWTEQDNQGQVQLHSYPTGMKIKEVKYGVR